MAEEEAVMLGWQAGPGRRGRLTIIANCLFTIFACTWTIQHLNIPGLDETWWQTFLRKCRWAAFTLFFPEFPMAHAILEFVMAVGDMRLLEENGHINLEDNLPWIFRLRRRRHPNPNDWSLTRYYFANMGGFYICDYGSLPKDDSLTDPTASNAPANQPARLLTTGHFIECWQHIKIPRLSEYDLKDKSKTDYFTKAIAVLQIAQLILSLIFQNVQHLAFSQLEALTLAFAICRVLTYQALINSKIKNDSKPLKRIPNDNIPKTKAHKTHYAFYILTALTARLGIATLISTIIPLAALLTIPLSQITVSCRNSEYSWHVADNHQVQNAIKDLATVCNTNKEYIHFKKILRDDINPRKFLRKKLLKYIQENAEFRGCLPNEFIHQFGQLVKILSGSISSKRLSATAKTDIYPRRSLFKQSINNRIIYTTGIMYCLARLIIIGVAISSLR
ncbi:hypothetical protein GGR58DRAFT_510249 [Xylaria digitata]|nr:hypothetical protein GGR58DRAFT_510249 [Xylaria digitata]